MGDVIDRIGEIVDATTVAAAALGCTGGYCASRLRRWWLSRPRVQARRARRRARREDAQ